ncbi:MAG TPA: hypothetical protein VK912_15850 [Longimicrobiales bacterium]|nr:hypothetical protein [Longimicrobiales bacterium]
MTDRNPKSAGRDKSSEAERETRNRGLQEEDKRQHDPDKHAPHRAVEQDAPEQERLTTQDEKDGEDIAQLENPPQSEGPREKSNDAV